MHRARQRSAAVANAPLASFRNPSLRDTEPQKLGNPALPDNERNQERRENCEICETVLNSADRKAESSLPVVPLRAPLAGFVP
jgi:hypothetical protein